MARFKTCFSSLFFLKTYQAPHDLKVLLLLNMFLALFLYNILKVPQDLFRPLFRLSSQNRRAKPK